MSFSFELVQGRVSFVSLLKKCPGPQKEHSKGFFVDICPAGCPNAHGPGECPLALYSVCVA